MKERLFARISRLFDVGAFGDAKVLVAGCGSGGGAVALQLTMSGFHRFTLVDKDILEPENVIRHVCGLRYLGWPKTRAVADVLRDRNPDVQVKEVQEDILTSNTMEKLVAEADVVVLATDNEPTRWLINDICVQTRTPFAVARVFTRGIGGEVFAYRPGAGGCLACLETVLERSQYRHGVHEIDLMDEQERDAIYGMDVAEIKDSPGLNVDISFITSFQTRFVMDLVARRLETRPAYLTPLDDNYIVWGNRPVPPFTKDFQIQRISMHALESCKVCGGKA